MTPLPQEDRYTFADLLQWDDNVRYELYSGVPVALASPSDTHQDISGEIYFQLKSYLRGKQCKAYYAPFDVRLFEEDGESPEDVDFVLQPDLMVVCDKNKVDRHGVHGAPDLVVEVLSPATARYDKIIKLSLYQRAGVPEYWIADPVSRSVSVYTLKNGVYQSPAVYGSNASIPVSVLGACQVDLSTVFP
jgi:Uma2 family endonuclease